MTKLSIKVFQHHKKIDGSYNVKIRIAHKGEKTYLNTEYDVKKEQLSSSFEITDPLINKNLIEKLDRYKGEITKIRDSLSCYSAIDIKDYLLNVYTDFNFIKFCDEHIKSMTAEGRKGSAGTLKTVMLSLQDHFKRTHVSPLEITENELSKYERFIRSERIIERLNHGKPIKRKVKGLGDAGVHNHMRDFRILYKAAMRFFNNPQFNDIKIPYCPFDKYRIVAAPETKKRNLKVDQIKLIRDCRLKRNSVAELSRDIFLLSFYLCGMNAVDIYNLTSENIVNNRIEYNRSKTKRKRKDRAFISIKLVREAEPLLNKYLGTISKRFSSSQNFDRSLNTGLRSLCKKVDMPPFTFYWARHSFGNIARNVCRFSVDDVALSLNHIDSYHKTTDIYLEKDWRIIDEVQKRVMQELRKNAESKSTIMLPKLEAVKFLITEISLPRLIK